MTQMDDILERLKGQQPMLENPDEMVDNIMANLPDREVQDAESEDREDRKAHTLLIALRTITSAAAMLLIGLFIYVNLPTEMASQQANTYRTDLVQGNTLENLYTRSLQKSQSNLISYTQFKQMLYEKN
ncbi:MAG: hypothetical protein J6T38_11325 [Bacteroidaceae bacterium]|nr:hypothetical protein [Bacteroidaceae bacterium]